MQQSGFNKEVHNIIGVPQETRRISNKLFNFTPKRTRKKPQKTTNKAQNQQKEGNNKIRMELNKIEMKNKKDQ